MRSIGSLVIPGTRLGPYEILEPIAAGGMGQVFRARDTRLNRIVAIKVIADALRGRPDLHERFRTEAAAIAALNHPHICQIYDVGEQDAIEYIVMEFVEGETLAARLQRGRLPLDQALAIARGVASALDAAHRQGIVHRDVKPSNIMLARTGAKLLDFGLARLRVAHVTTGIADVAALSTVAPAAGSLTDAGVALGTWQYMAPEQVRGEPADARSDVFSLGAVIYEMVTGRRAFESTSHANLVTAILEADPPAMELPAVGAPAPLEHIVRTCLAKSPDDRWQSAGDVGRALAAATVAPAVRADARPAARGRTWMAAAALALVSTGIVATLALRPERPVVPGVVRTSILLGDVRQWSPTPYSPAFLPDGSGAIVGGNRGGGPGLLWRIDLGTGAVTPIEGTEYGMRPFVSPDGQWIGFFGRTHLMKVPIGGGRPVALTGIQQPFGASWGSDDTIVFSGRPESGLMRIPASGGTPVPVSTMLPEDRGDDHRNPQWLPGGQRLLFGVGTGPEDAARIAALDLTTGRRKDVLQGSMTFRYVETGHLAYARNGTIYVMPFDPSRLEATGPPAPIAEGVESFDSPAEFSFSRSGDLVYQPGDAIGPQDELALLQLNGIVEDIKGPRGSFEHPRFSPDGSRIAVMRFGAKVNIWVYDLARSTFTRVTSGRYRSPVWHPDGMLTLAQGGPGRTRIVRRGADGSGSDELLTSGDTAEVPLSWSPDGRTLVFERRRGMDLWDLWSVSPGHGSPTALVESEYSQRFARISPDGGWLLYSVGEPGGSQVHVRNIRDGRNAQVSVGGAVFAVWSPDGRRIYYRGTLVRGGPAGIWEVELRTTPTLSIDKPRELFPNPGFAGPFDISPDGRRFVMTRLPSQPQVQHLNLIQNWFRQRPATR